MWAMAASVSDIIELVLVKSSNKTAAVHQGPPFHHRPQDASNASPAPSRSSRTRSPVRSLSAPHA